MDKEFEWCPCGKPLNHKDRCLSIRTDKRKEKIGRYPGYSKSYTGFQKTKKEVEFL